MPLDTECGSSFNQAGPPWVPAPPGAESYQCPEIPAVEPLLGSAFWIEVLLHNRSMFALFSDLIVVLA